MTITVEQYTVLLFCCGFFAGIVAHTAIAFLWAEDGGEDG